jgi:hypothetical protein
VPAPSDTAALVLPPLRPSAPVKSYLNPSPGRDGATCTSVQAAAGGAAARAPDARWQSVRPADEAAVLAAARSTRVRDAAAALTGEASPTPTSPIRRCAMFGCMYLLSATGVSFGTMSSGPDDWLASSAGHKLPGSQLRSCLSSQTALCPAVWLVLQPRLRLSLAQLRAGVLADACRGALILLHCSIAHGRHSFPAASAGCGRRGRRSSTPGAATPSPRTMPMDRSGSRKQGRSWNRIAACRPTSPASRCWAWQRCKQVSAASCCVSG